MSNHYLVIGGTKGGGRQLVNMLVADETNSVSVFGRTPAFENKKPNLKEYGVDVTDYDSAISGLKEAVKNFGNITSVVFMQRHRSKADEFSKDMDVGVNSTKAIIDFLVANKLFSNQACIVMVSSIADTYIAEEQLAGYHVSKAGLVQLGRYFALKLGNLGIRVNSVSPCVVLKAEATDFYNKNQKLVSRYKKFIPLARMGTPEDIANAIIFLTSEKASYITGQNLVVDGGLTLRSHESLLRDIN